LITLSADEGNEQSYTVDSTKTGQQGQRLAANRNMQGRYIKVLVSNVNGCDFGFDAMDMMLVVMPHRFTI